MSRLWCGLTAEPCIKAGEPASDGIVRPMPRRCSDTDNDPDRCSLAVWSLESCHTDRSPATNDDGNQGKHRVEFGVVYSCVEDKMYSGRRGNGAYCNGQKLQISGQKDITKSMIITELGSNRDPDVMKIILSNMERLLCIPIHGIRAVGTAAVDMCLVATGGADAYYEMGIHCWDVAAASVIVTEAGGLVLDAKGGPFDMMSRRVIAASSKEIGERIAKELQIIPLERDDIKKE
ncbi:unnamed protein product [Ranitomeya imitator]|uniref:Inositol monophosphatase 1 n=1 Tax=Ranitomeya imitator TaxID=111125 RepID=A0ABN9LBC3_9NEOB|nr:unnamed protein product [Ranitomeya imitator]